MNKAIENKETIFCNYAFIAINVFFVLQSIYNFNFVISSGLDSSWAFFLNHLNTIDLKFGKNLFFTYGPLGFLGCVENIGKNLLISNLFWILYAVISSYLFHTILKESERTISNVLKFSLASFMFAVGNSMGDRNQIVFMALLLMALIWKKNELKWIILFDIFFVILFFFKFACFFMLACSFAIFTITWLLLKKDKRTLLYMWLSFPVMFFVYLVYNPSIRSFFRYIRGGIEISVGFSSAMSSKYEGPQEHVVWIIVGALICFATTFFIWKKDKDKAGVFFSLCASLFFFYKQGFVRHSGRAAFGGLAFVLTIVFLLFEWRGYSRYVKAGFASLICIVVIYYGGINNSILGYIKRNVLDYPVSLKTSMDDKGEKTAKVPQKFKDKIGTATVAAFPWELSYASDRDLNFMFMPALQNYSAYTPWLDMKDAEFFSHGDNVQSPEFIIFRTDTIDGRIPLIETPKTWAAIQRNYKIVDEEAGNYLLQKVASNTYKFFGNIIASEDFYRNSENKFCDIKRNPDADYFSINAKYSIGGKILNAIWKTPEVRMRVFFEDGTSCEGRVLFNNLIEPIAVDNIWQPFSKLMKGNNTKKAKCVEFFGDGCFMFKKIQVNWLKSDMNFVMPKYEDSLSFPLSNVLANCNEIASNDDLLYSVDDKDFYSNGCRVRGWLFDNRPGIKIQSIYLQVDEKAFPVNYNLSRPDVADYFSNKDMANTGFDSEFTINGVSSAQDIALLVLTSNGDYYRIGLK